MINTGGRYSGYISNVDGARYILRARILDEVAPGQPESERPAISPEQYTEGHEDSGQDIPEKQSDEAETDQVEEE